MLKRRRGKSARAKRTNSTPSLIKKLDRVFSIWVRLRDSDENGNCACVTCGKRMHWKEAHAGHFIKRQHMSVRFDPHNVHAQCPADNVYKGGCQDEYALYIQKTYGAEELERLMADKRKTKKWTREELETLISVYESSPRDPDSACMNGEA